ncbi:MAG TPA: hypothetical protein PLV21_04970 [Cyclobacteriaceae bacterium]|nr:hypothetical protein [Cyclobacteriaceae bacterium]HRJ81211.1 hypothetical protein [Cyclobacteriaceae bacterium]
MNSGFLYQLNELLDIDDNNPAALDRFDSALKDLAKTGLSIFLTKEDFLNWLNTPSIDCQGRCPKDLMNRISAIKDLISILKRISHGIPY